MAEPNLAPQPDLRDLRIAFLDKQLAYALSYAYEFECVDATVPGFRSVRLRPSAREESKVFHVLRADRVPGLDNRGYDVPIEFKISGLDETVALRVAEKPGGGGNSSAASVEGRMVFEAGRDGDKADTQAVRISVSYDGVLRFEQEHRPDDALYRAMPRTARASAFVVPFFETTHPKYHWLTEHACIAFGTWELEKGIVKASFDVYTAE